MRPSASVTLANLLSQGPRNFLSEGLISCYTTVRRLDILHDVIVLGYVKFYQINKFFVNIIIKMSFRPDEMTSRAVVWRPCAKPCCRTSKRNSEKLEVVFHKHKAND